MTRARLFWGGAFTLACAAVSGSLMYVSPPRDWLAAKVAIVAATAVLGIRLLALSRRRR